MRLPFLQVDADFLATGARDLSELLRNSEAEAGWSMVRLWGWAVSKAATPDALGLLEGEDMQRLAERAAGWKGEPGAFLAALLNPAVGLAQREGGGAVRLLGMDRYATTFRKMEADRARKAGRPRGDVARTSGGSPPDVARKTQTQTQTQKEETASQAPRAAPVTPGEEAVLAFCEGESPDATRHAEEVHPERPPLELVSQSPGRKPRQPSKAEVLYAALQDSRRERCEEVGAEFVDDGWKPARMNRDLGALARLEEDSPEAKRLNAAWAEYLADESRAGMDVPWSLGYFLASRSTWEGRAIKAAGGAS